MDLHFVNKDIKHHGPPANCLTYGVKDVAWVNNLNWFIQENKKEQERARLDKEIALFNKKMILYIYFSYTDNISCYGLIINEYDITDDK